MANAAKGYVVPIGFGVGSGIWGPDYDPNDWKTSKSPNGVFDIYGPDGQLDPRGPNASAIDAWNAQRLGYGTVAAPNVLNMGANEAMRRYAGDPDNGGAGGWDARWKQWNATDTYNPDGTIDLLSPMHATGLRIGQNYGARDYDGNPIEAGSSDMWNTAKGVRNSLNQDYWLDPTNVVSGSRWLLDNSTFAEPNSQDYLSTMQQATGGPGQADFYGQRGLQQAGYFNKLTDFDQYGRQGLDQTRNLDEVNQRQLSRNIDRETELSLGTQLPEISHAMEAAGLGRSGAGQLQLMQANNAAREQGMRDKNRVMADFTDRAANREAAAINLQTQQGYGGMGQKFNALQNAASQGSQIGAQGYGQYSQQMGQAALAGLGDEFQMNQANRQNEQALYSQQMQNRYTKNQNDQSALFGMLSNAGSQQNQRMQMEDQGRSMAQADWLALQGNRDQSQASSLNQALALANAQRQIQQDRLNQMLQAGMQPWDTQLRIATGTTAPSGPAPQNNSFWDSGMGRAAGNIGSSAFNAWLNGGGGNDKGMGYNPNEF